MAAPAIPTGITAEWTVGGALAAVGGLVLLVHASAVPAFVVDLLVGFGTDPDFWLLLGASLLVLVGGAAVVRGRRRRRAHLRFLARRDAMRERHRSPDAPVPAPSIPTPIGRMLP